MIVALLVIGWDDGWKYSNKELEKPKTCVNSCKRIVWRYLSAFFLVKSYVDFIYTVPAIVLFVPEWR